MIFAITMIFFILNIIFLTFFFVNHGGVMDKWFEDSFRATDSLGYLNDPASLIAVAGFSPFPFLNILMFCHIFSKYRKYSKE